MFLVSLGELMRMFGLTRRLVAANKGVIIILDKLFLSFSQMIKQSCFCLYHLRLLPIVKNLLILQIYDKHVSHQLSSNIIHQTKNFIPVT